MSELIQKLEAFRANLVGEDMNYRACLVDEAISRIRALEVTLAVASAHVGVTPHGDNCYLTDEYPGNQCVCGKESTLAVIDSALEPT